MLHVLATAYCDSGLTRSGVPVRPGIIAVDPRVFPFGTVLAIRSPHFTGRIFVAADTGGLIRWRRVDVYMPICAEALKFGAQRVVVDVVAPARRGTRMRDLVRRFLGR